MAIVVLPRSLVTLFPGLSRRQDVAGETVASVIERLEAMAPGFRDRVVESGPRLRPHINVYVAGRPADLATPVADVDTVHVIPAVSGGALRASPGKRRPPAPAGTAERPFPAPRRAPIVVRIRRAGAATPSPGNARRNSGVRSESAGGPC